MINRSVFSLRLCPPVNMRPSCLDPTPHKLKVRRFSWILTVLCSPPPASPPPHRVCLLMEQGGGAEGGPGSPQLQDSDSPKDRGESPAFGGPPQTKTSHAEVNGSPANAPRRLNGSPLRPLGGVNTWRDVVLKCFLWSEVVWEVLPQTRVSHSSLQWGGHFYFFSIVMIYKLFWIVLDNQKLYLI